MGQGVVEGAAAAAADGVGAGETGLAWLELVPHEATGSGDIAGWAAVEVAGFEPADGVSGIEGIRDAKDLVGQGIPAVAPGILGAAVELDGVRVEDVEL